VFVLSTRFGAWHWTSEITALDVSDPEHVDHLDSVYAGSLEGPPIVDISYGDGLLVATEVHTDCRIRVLDVSSPASMAFIGGLEVEALSAYGVARTGRLALVAGGFWGLRVVDLSSPSNPWEIARLDIPGEAVAVAATNDIVLVGEQRKGLRLLSAAGSESLHTVGFMSRLGIGGVACNGDLAVLTLRQEGLAIVDVSDSSRPIELGALDTPGGARVVVLDGAVAYVADGSAGLRVIDLSAPHLPVEIGSIALPGSATDVAISGRTACIAADGGGLVLVDVTDPASPATIAVHTASGRVRAVDVADGLAYLVGDLLSVVDIRDPSHPVELASVPFQGYDVAVSGGRVVALQGGRVVVFDVSTPEDPLLMAVAVATGHPAAVSVDGGGVYVADGAGGTRVLDLSGCTRAPPQASFAWSPDAPTVRAAVCFSDTGSGPVVERLWELGDGSTSTSETACHEYSRAGFIPVTLTVSNPFGTDRLTRVVPVGPLVRTGARRVRRAGP